VRDLVVDPSGPRSERDPSTTPPARGPGLGLPSRPTRGASRRGRSLARPGAARLSDRRPRPHQHRDRRAHCWSVGQFEECKAPAPGRGASDKWANSVRKSDEAYVYVSREPWRSEDSGGSPCSSRAFGANQPPCPCFLIGFRDSGEFRRRIRRLSLRPRRRVFGRCWLTDREELSDAVISLRFSLR
jgi:hypothetical protein